MVQIQPSSCMASVLSVYGKCSLSAEQGKDQVTNKELGKRKSVYERFLRGVVYVGYGLIRPWDITAGHSSVLYTTQAMMPKCECEG